MSPNAELIPRNTDEREPTQAMTTTPAQLLAIAVNQGADLEKLEKLMALQERWEANEARKAYVAAMADFKAEPMRIGKNKHVSFRTSSGMTEYDHAELSDVIEAVVPRLAAHGFSHGWTVTQNNGAITVACIVTHRLGHSERVEMTAPPDSSGGKNNIQAIGSTKTYLERYTLLAATGLATGGDDDDGRGGVETGAMTGHDEDAKAAQRKARHDEALGRHVESVAFIKERIAAGDLAAVASEWSAIPQPDQMALWLATSKGGCFTTEERRTIKEDLPKKEAVQ